MMQEMLCFIKQTAAYNPQLPADPTELGLLPLERFMQHEFLVSDFEEADFFKSHQACCTGTKAFCNSGTRNDWVWVQTGGEENYGDLRRQAVA